MFRDLDGQSVSSATSPLLLLVKSKNNKMKKALACSIFSGDLYVIGTRLYAFSQGWISSTDKTFEIIKIGLAMLEAAGMTYCYLEASEEKDD
jgi:hypothetical protein